MDKKTDYYIVEASALPEVIVKTLEAKRLLETGKEKTVQNASNRVGISRSAFYKYRDLVFPFYENSRGKTVTIALNLDNMRGVLSSILNAVADFGTNILTINQTIPINYIANVTISIETGGAKGDLSALIDSLIKINGVQSCKIIARE